MSLAKVLAAVTAAAVAATAILPPDARSGIAPGRALREAVALDVASSGVCPSFVRFIQSPPDPTDYPTGSFTVEYGEEMVMDPSGVWCVSSGGPDPATFRFTINGADYASLFTHDWAPSGEYMIATGTAVPLAPGTANTFVASIPGYDSAGTPVVVQATAGAYVYRHTISTSVIARPGTMEAATSAFVTWRVVNTGTKTMEFSFACTTSGSLSCGTVSPALAMFAPGQSRNLTVRVTSGSSAGAAGATLTATTTFATGSATDSVTVVRPPTLSLAYTGGERRIRAGCPTVGAGAGSAVQCGDLLYAHAFPAYRTMNKARGLTLLYNSATAHPTPTVVVDYATYPDEPVSTLVARVIRTDSGPGFGAVLRELTFTPTPVFSSAIRRVHRLVVPIDAASANLSTGAYAVRVELSRIANGVAQRVDTAATRVHVVDRRASAFGAGWWPAGVEQLYPGPDGVLLVHADGSTVFFRNAPGSLVSPPGEWSRLETLAGGAGYRRRLKGNRVTMYYGATGRVDSLRDNNPERNVARYRWKALGAGGYTLDSIIDPMGKAVSFGRNPTTGRIDSIRIPGVALIRLHQTPTPGGVGATLDSIGDPDGFATRFGYESTTYRLTTSRARGTGTYRYAYDAVSRVDSVVPPVSTAIPPTRYHAWQRSGAPTPAAPGTTSQPAQAAFPDSVRFWTISSRRAGQSESAVWFMVHPTGAPTRVRPPDDNRTEITRDSIGQPTRVRTELGVDVRQLWDTLGNLREVSRKVPGPWTARTATRWDTTRYSYHPAWQTPTEISPPTRPKNVVTFGYDSYGRRDTVRDALGRETHFSYRPNGLPQQIAEPDARNAGQELWPTVYRYDSTGTWNLVAVTKHDRTTTYVYDAANGSDVVAARNPRAEETRYYYDAMKRVRAVARGTAVPAYDSVAYGFDDTARTRTLRDPLGKVTTTLLDEAGRVIETRHPDGDYSAVVYNGVDVIRLRERGGMFQYQSVDGLGRLATRSTRVGSPPPPVFGDSGAPSATDLQTDSVTYLYDGAGNLRRIENRFSRIVRSYDLLGRLTCEHQALRYWRDGTFTWTDTSRSGGVTAYHEYDAMGRRARSFVGTGGCDDPYVGPGAETPIEEEVPGESDWLFLPEAEPVFGAGADTWVPAAHELKYTYDDVGNVATIRNALWSGWGQPKTWTYESDRKNRPVALSLPVASTAGNNVWTYDDDDDLVGYESYLHRSDALVRDALGRVEEHRSNYGVGNYLFDALGRVTRELNTLAPDDTFTYDVNGNRASDSQWLYHYESTVNGALTGRLEWKERRDAAGGCSFAYQYDARGNQTALWPRGGLHPRNCGYVGTTMEYDRENRMVRSYTWSSSQTVACGPQPREEAREFRYDGLRRRILMVSTNPCADDRGLWRYFWLDDHVAVKIGNSAGGPSESERDLWWPSIGVTTNGAGGRGEWFFYGPGTDNVLASWTFDGYSLTGINQRRLFLKDYRGSVSAVAYETGGLRGSRSSPFSVTPLGSSEDHSLPRCVSKRLQAARRSRRPHAGWASRDRRSSGIYELPDQRTSHERQASQAGARQPR